MRLVLALVLLAACGDGIAAPDATLAPDASAGLVRVQYYGDTLVGNRVFFQNADSSMVLSTRTDGFGVANAYMQPGGFVTLVATTGNTFRIYTWASVQPGDDLFYAEPGSGSQTYISLSLPIDAGQTIYDLSSSCGHADVRLAAGTSQIVELAGCATRADMFVYTAGNGFHYLYREDVPISEGALVAFAPPYRSMERSTVAFSHAPAAATQLIVSQGLIGEDRVLFRGLELGIGTGIVDVAAGAFNFDMPLPVEGTVLTEMYPLDGQGIGTPHVVRWESSRPVTSVDFDVGALRAFASAPTYDRVTHAIRWAEGNGAPGEVVYAQWGWSRVQIGGNYVWRIVAPRTAEPVLRLPVLPSDLHPRENDSILEPINYGFALIGIDGGYDRVRRRLMEWTPSGAWPVDGRSGNVVYQDLTPFAFPPDG